MKKSFSNIIIQRSTEGVFVDECKTRKSRGIDLQSQRYLETPGITSGKKNDLLTLCRKNYIPAQHHGYFESIETNESKEADDSIVET